ncbi:MAG: hypothetical protein KGJ32_08610 [Xanthomonadaceae bacterium]|nr:hypothetical protein [Xanthomonadaceae bacterium]
MTHCATPSEKDLLGSRRATGLLWIGPWVLIIISAGSGNLVRTLVWTFGFTVMGAACLINARRCGRLHCFYTGPLFLMAALSSLLYGLGILPLGRHGWNWILDIAAVGAVLACGVMEKLSGKYAGSSKPGA